MTTLGDVWAITALVIGIAFCAWASLLCLALLSPNRSRMAMEAVEARTGRHLVIGLLAAVVGGTGGAMMAGSPFPLLKIVGMAMLLALMALSFCGTAGIVLLVTKRIQAMDDRLSPYVAFSRAAMIVVVPSILPVLGWFLYAPIVFALGLGVGLSVRRVPEVSLATPPFAG
ncbi:hypothetical protein BH11ARM1_BH11ARM1_06370 [soil metagenome]